MEFGAGLANGVEVKVTVDTSGEPLRNGAATLVVLAGEDVKNESWEMEGLGTTRVAETGTAGWVERIVVMADPCESVDTEVTTSAEDAGNGDVAKIVEKYVVVDPEESVDTIADTTDIGDDADAGFDAGLKTATIDVDVVRDPAEFVVMTLITDELAEAKSVDKDVVTEPGESVIVSVETDSVDSKGAIRLVEVVVEPNESDFVTRLIEPLTKVKPDVDGPEVMKVTPEMVGWAVDPDSTLVIVEEVGIKSTVDIDEALEAASDGLPEPA